jgi:hypothetical protein
MVGDYENLYRRLLRARGVSALDANPKTETLVRG